MDTQFLTVNEVAKRVRVNPRTVRRWIDDGKLPAVKVVNCIRVKSEDIEDLAKITARPTHAKNRPDMNAIMDKVEQTLAASQQNGETNTDQETKRREDVFQHRY